MAETPRQRSPEQQAREKERKRLYNLKRTAERQAAAGKIEAIGTIAKTASKPAKRSNTTKARPEKSAKVKASSKKRNGTGKARGLSCLDAAFVVLSRSGKALHPKELVKRMLTKTSNKPPLWSTTGKTPFATLWSGLIGEIDRKGKASRFVKVGEGLFGLNKSVAGKPKGCGE